MKLTKQARRRRTRATLNHTASLEVLEDRMLLTGNVTAEIVNGDLRVTGDAEDNAIQIVGQDGEGVLVTPFDGTTVNGFSMPQFIPVDSPIDDVFLTFTKGGNNTIETREFMTEDDVVYKGGKQEDVFVARGMTVGGDINAKTGNGDDFVSVIGGSIDNSVKVNTGNDDDHVMINEPRIENDLVANLGKGDDTIYLAFVQIGDDANIKLGSGDDTLLADNANIADRLKLIMGSGNDRAWAGGGSSVAGKGLINGSSGEDRVLLGDVNGEPPTVKGIEVGGFPGLDQTIDDFFASFSDSVAVFGGR